jgi:hypothetical protein
LKHKTLRDVVKLLGIKSSKEDEVNEALSKHLSLSLSAFGNMQSRDVRDVQFQKCS